MVEINRIPPQAIELEKALIGALMIENESFEAISNYLRKESFYEFRHGLIYETIKKIANENRGVDLLSVTNELRNTGVLEQIGGIVYITELANQAPMAANIESFARIISEKFAAREMIRILGDLTKKCFDPVSDIEELVNGLQIACNDVEKLFETGDTGTPQQIVAKNTLTEIYSDVEKYRKERQSGILTGFRELNTALGGWRPTNLIILAARPGVGKTSLALHFATTAAKAGYSINFFSLEMTENQLFKIILSAQSEINRTQIRDGKLSNDELKQLEKATGNIEKLPIIWNDRPANINMLKSKVKRNYKAGRCDMVIIDYLQLIEPTDRKMIREQQISEISRTLKGLALELRIPIICLSQLNRMAETDAPQLHHLRESGAIEQDADVVLFPYRPNPGEFKIIIGKSRHGRTGNIDIYANDQMTVFSDSNTYNPNFKIESKFEPSESPF